MDRRSTPSQLFPLRGSGEIPAGSQPWGVCPGTACSGIHLVTEPGSAPREGLLPASRGIPASPAPRRSPGIRLERDPLGAGAQSVGAAARHWPGRAKPAPCSAELCGDPRWIPGDPLRAGSARCCHESGGCCHLGATLEEGVRSSGSVEIPAGSPLRPWRSAWGGIHWLPTLSRRVAALGAAWQEGAGCSTERQGNPGWIPAVTWWDPPGIYPRGTHRAAGRAPLQPCLEALIHLSWAASPPQRGWGDPRRIRCSGRGAIPH